MSATTIVWLVTAVALAAVLAFAAVHVLRALRELERAKARVAAYGDLPVVAALARGQTDVQRLQAALARISPLVARVQPAVATIRRGPVPPDLLAGIALVRRELAGLSREIASLRRSRG